MGAVEREQAIPVTTYRRMASSDKWGVKKAGKRREKNEVRDIAEEFEKVWEGRKQEIDINGRRDCQKPNKDIVRASRSKTEHMKRGN